MRPFPDGNGIGGAIYISTDLWGQPYKEYIATCLTLQAGVTYTMTLFIGSFPVSVNGQKCNRGNIFYGDVDVTLFGFTDCIGALPITDCPYNTQPRWDVLGSANYTPTPQWKKITITFIPTKAYKTIMIGAPCNLGADYAFSNCYPYFAYDDVVITALINCDDNNPCTVDRCN